MTKLPRQYLHLKSLLFQDRVLFLKPHRVCFLPRLTSLHCPVSLLIVVCIYFHQPIPFQLNHCS